jgi:hypothetical protein
VIDHMSPQAATWVRGISLDPAEPRITALVLTGYRELLLWAIDSKNAEREAHYRKTIRELGGEA